MTVRPVEPGPDDPRLGCPRDGAAMRRFDFAGVTVDRCIHCGGIWLDLGELRRVLETDGDARDELRKLDSGHAPDDSPSVVAGRRGACPRDTTLLTAVRDARQRHIEYDLCTHCGGVFFDAGELVDLSEFTLRERLRWMSPGLSGKDDRAAEPG